MTGARWVRHGRRPIYRSEWVNLYLDEVELPDGGRIDHHVLTFPKASQSAVVVNAARDEILLVWRHRYIPDTWSWEVPAGWAEPGEDRETAMRRELLEETGHVVDRMSPLAEYDVFPGLSTMVFTCWLGTGPTRLGDPADTNEVSHARWHRVDSLPGLVREGTLRDGGSLAALANYQLFRAPVR